MTRNNELMHILMSIKLQRESLKCIFHHLSFCFATGFLENSYSYVLFYIVQFTWKPKRERKITVKFKKKKQWRAPFYFLPLIQNVFKNVGFYLPRSDSRWLTVRPKLAYFLFFIFLFSLNRKQQSSTQDKLWALWVIGNLIMIHLNTPRLIKCP